MRDNFLKWEKIPQKSRYSKNFRRFWKHLYYKCFHFSHNRVTKGGAAFTTYESPPVIEDTSHPNTPTKGCCGHDATNIALFECGCTLIGDITTEGLIFSLLTLYIVQNFSLPLSWRERLPSFRLDCPSPRLGPHTQRVVVVGTPQTSNCSRATPSVPRNIPNCGGVCLLNFSPHSWMIDNR